MVEKILRIFWMLPPKVQKALNTHAPGYNKDVYDILYFYTEKQLCNIYGISTKGAKAIISARKKVQQ